MIPAFILKWLTARVGQRFARPAAIALAIIAAVLMIFVAKALYDRRVIADHEAEQGAADIERTANANAAATVERAHDDIRITDKARKRDEAIITAPQGLPGPATVQLNCERLRQSGYATDEIPPCR